MNDLKGVFPAEETIQQRMRSVYAEQERDARMMTREELLLAHYLGWKDWGGQIHCDPHPDDGYLPLTAWESID